MNADQTGDVLTDRLKFTCALARKVGQEADRFWKERGPENLGVQTKTIQDFVTVADKIAEDTIREAISIAYPEDGFIGEETGGSMGNGDYWVVDPIDGTANYLRGLRHWGVSIAYVRRGITAIGVVHDSPTDRIYSAIIGQGASQDGDKISVSNTRDPHHAVGIFGISRRAPFQKYLDDLRALFDAGIEHRRIGSAAIGIVRVAEGVSDFYFENHLNSWDALAALLIAKEAGAQNFTLPLSQFMEEGSPVLSATPHLADQLKLLLAAP
jgi:myo-inositol-1(or 4)-monophosphatase